MEIIDFMETPSNLIEDAIDYAELSQFQLFYGSCDDLGDDICINSKAFI